MQHNTLEEVTVIRSILVPLDGSSFAETALPLAVALAKKDGARIRLLSVHTPQPDVPLGLDRPIVESQNVAIRSAIQSYLAEKAAGLAPAPVTTEVVDGAAGPALVEAADRHRPDFLVMSTHGRGPVSRFWLGSVADHLLRHVMVPVLLVRPSEGTGPPTIRRLLVALDLSEESQASLEPAVKLAQALSAKLTMLHVVEPIVGIVDGALPFPLPVDAGSLERRKQEATRRLTELAEPLRGQGIEVETRLVVGVGAAQTILDEAARDGHEAIAMTTHGAGGVRRLLVGSVADKVIRGSERPVLVVRQPDR